MLAWCNFTEAGLVRKTKGKKNFLAFHKQTRLNPQGKWPILRQIISRHLLRRDNWSHYFMSSSICWSSLDSETNLTAPLNSAATVTAPFENSRNGIFSSLFREVLLSFPLYKNAVKTAPAAKNADPNFWQACTINIQTIRKCEHREKYCNHWQWVHVDMTRL